MVEINETHDPAARSWVDSANLPDTDFPIQNLALGVFRTRDRDRARIGVASGFDDSPADRSRTSPRRSPRTFAEKMC